MKSLCFDRTTCSFRFLCEIQHADDEVCILDDLKKEKEVKVSIAKSAS
jgi:hypothetical protein